MQMGAGQPLCPCKNTEWLANDRVLAELLNEFAWTAVDPRGRSRNIQVAEGRVRVTAAPIYPPELVRTILLIQRSIIARCSVSAAELQGSLLDP